MTASPPDSFARLYARVGEALNAWSSIEDSLLAIFMCAISARNPDAAQAAFWRIVSFDAKLGATDAAIRVALSKHTTHFDAWLDIWAKLSKRKTNRNKLAHAQVIGAQDDKQPRLFPYFSALTSNLPNWNGGWTEKNIAAITASFRELDAEMISFLRRLGRELDMWPTDHRPDAEQ